MPDSISLLNVIKQGGFDASLITTFNASLPFYEEVLLRRLVAAGCHQNIVLMDHAQCSLSWQSEATRPRLAGIAYSLLPVNVRGAFHPKVCILAGKKKASILVGSHNLTLSGFGYNREITNWVHVTDRKDQEGAALLDSIWQMAQEWIELAREQAPPSLIEAVLSFSKSVAPLSSPGATTTTVALHQRPGGASLIEQIDARVKGEVRRIGVTGAFFDSDLAFVAHLHERWPQADVVIAIDPETVHLPSMHKVQARFVDARLLWTNPSNCGDKYLHAKALYIEQTHDNGNALISGSANPSRPAWMGDRSRANVEAVMMRIGPDAQVTAEALGLYGMFALPPLSARELEATATRSVTQIRSIDESAERFWIGVAANPNELQIATPGGAIEPGSACLLSDNLDVIQANIAVTRKGDVLSIPVSIDVKLVRACDLYLGSERVARAMIAHPHLLTAETRSSHRQVRDALGALDPSGESISEMLKAVEAAIFEPAAEEEIQNEVRLRRGSAQAHIASGGRPDTFEISVTELCQTRRRRRLVESADIITLIDLLTRKFGEELRTQPTMPMDRAGRTEEEQVNQDDNPEQTEDGENVDAQVLRDAEIARRVGKKVTRLINRMLVKLTKADRTDTKARALVQLIAVLSLVKELVRIERLPRWQMAREFLVPEAERRRLLDESMWCLFNSRTRLIDTLTDDTNTETEEAIQLRVLLLWLAWIIGEKVPESSVDAFDTNGRNEKLRAKAIFLALAPPVAADAAASDDLRRYTAATLRSNPLDSARADKWIRLTNEFGQFWSRDLSDAPQIEVGGCCIVGDCNYPRLVAKIHGELVDFWDFGSIRSFKQDFVMAVQPEVVSG
ncbi:hypothetical protein [Pandoraea fibrosis]|uniref:Phospholipase D-like domain-containing protein n=1 Tax=Pandoraea fibrosis TaxID=1891094 RepID=A0A5E4WRH0_9BURK|nr:hypothetical protein [Pandoraea fibrosis]QHE90378.1 hypothetical protein PJ20_000020 [Pandoraea fibrosis]QHF11210.1 hypothetical protein PI93_000020 [Pandoraea fibrosis]VVE26290.1 hypothetical protein PFI31113_03372 [Pandoraea fibrosis]